MTNFEKIKNMNYSELACFLSEIYDHGYGDGYEEGAINEVLGIEATIKFPYTVQWLESEVEE